MGGQGGPYLFQLIRYNKVPAMHQTGQLLSYVLGIIKSSEYTSLLHLCVVKYYLKLWFKTEK